MQLVNHRQVACKALIIGIVYAATGGNRHVSLDVVFAHAEDGVDTVYCRGLTACTVVSL